MDGAVVEVHRPPVGVVGERHRLRPGQGRGVGKGLAQAGLAVDLAHGVARGRHGQARTLRDGHRKIGAVGAVGIAHGVGDPVGTQSQPGRIEGPAATPVPLKVPPAGVTPLAVARSRAVLPVLISRSSLVKTGASINS